MVKDRKEILKEEKVKKRVEIQQTKVEKKEKKKRYLREVIVKIQLKQKKKEKEIVVETLLNSRATKLVINKEFTRKYRFRRTKLERLIYIRNVNSTLNYMELIVDIIEIKIFLKNIRRELLKLRILNFTFFNFFF